ncbi:ATP-dependent DNA ligase [Rhizobium anhuiense]|uniref:DNA ligase (ATP) n=1 Tax=Rhizobium anhuiense TaxID=1184720 RepID=A0ABX4J086_9HYPH|nr:non-homologous end-joining DNA ligase [Rhizobium anhuiense]PDS48576.1 ATP-dependent DNA ligase [Rhizobium anhuiense]
MKDRPRSKPLLADDRPLKGWVRKPRDPSQPNLPFDPMPERVEPCLALLKQKPPSGPQWLYEIKFDGYRLAIHVDHGRVRAVTRGGHDWTDRFPAIVAAARKLDVATAILDGEAVVLDEEGRPDFGALQQSLGGRGGRLPSDAIFYAFDLLYFDGHDISGMELSSRRHLLESLVHGDDRTIRLSETIDGSGAQIFEAACRHGLEGIIAKDRDSPYRSGRTGDWLKVKCVASDSFMIVGYERSPAARGQIGSLILAAYKKGVLVHVGSVGTGFKQKQTSELRSLLDRLVTKKPPVSIEGRRPDVVWVEPVLIAEIEYRAFTHDGKLRHASYKGLREVQDNAAVFKIED